MKDSHSLTTYKKYVREIKHKKGTVAWLREFVKLGKEYGIPDAKNPKSLLTAENLSPQEFIFLGTIITRLEAGESCGFINKGLADFLLKYGFSVEPVEIGWIVSGENL